MISDKLVTHLKQREEYPLLPNFTGKTMNKELSLPSKIDTVDISEKIKERFEKGE